MRVSSLLYRKTVYARAFESTSFKILGVFCLKHFVLNIGRNNIFCLLHPFEQDGEVGDLFFFFSLIVFCLLNLWFWDDSSHLVNSHCPCQNNMAFEKFCGWEPQNRDRREDSHVILSHMVCYMMHSSSKFREIHRKFYNVFVCIFSW